jgi:hypothetical protein
MHGVSLNEPLAPGQRRNWTVTVQAAGTPDSTLPQWGVQDHASHELSVRLRDPGGGLPPLGRTGILTLRYCFDAAACGCGVRVDGGAGVTIAGSFGSLLYSPLTPSASRFFSYAALHAGRATCLFSVPSVGCASVSL